MKAIVQDRYGPPETLTLADVPAPVPAADEVLVRVEAAALNAYDWHAMRGDPRIARLAMGRSVPRARIRGRDFAGRVEAVGTDVRQVRPGDAVFGDLGDANGAFAEYVCVPETSIAPKPANLTPQQAAALPLAGTTALMGLCDVGRVESGHRVLVNGASGGVGTLAVQLAKALGATVTGVCSTRNVDLVRSLGADHVVDYTRDDFAHDTRRHDVVFDLVGNRSLTVLRRVLTPTGTLVLSGGGVYRGGSLLGPVWLIARGRLLAPFVRHRVVILTTAPSRRHLDTLHPRRGRPPHTGHRPHLSTPRGASGHPVPRRRARAGENRHHRLTGGQVPSEKAAGSIQQTRAALDRAGGSTKRSVMARNLATDQGQRREADVAVEMYVFPCTVAFS